MAKYHFIIIGSGWRALYYVRVAKALPEIFSLDAMYCRTQEKADLIAGQYQIHTTTSIEECVAYKPWLLRRTPYAMFQWNGLTVE